jgi:hypothetical protein
MFEDSLLLMALATLKETLDSTAADGAKLKQALMAAQGTGSDASTDSIMEALSTFRNTVNDGPLQADAILEILQIDQAGRLDDTADDIPPASKSR